MPEFKISPITQYDTRHSHGFLFWFLLAILAIDIGMTSWMFFRLTNRIENLERQLQSTTTRNGGIYV
ncbi:MAG: hypothetical protein LBB21_04330 [Holosporaceae bacterium]|jgi:hypothetical protein|nr:hypothetical protein [Holosporaceae bacterium]